jgi:pimeloyl-ACP methyl ester carboxylesterase
MAGSTVRTVGYRQSDLPLTPVEGLVSDAPIVVLGWGADGETTERIALPGDYDPAVAVPLVLFAHGSSTDESSVLGTSMVKVYTALLQAGYAVASSSQHGNNWGNDASVQDLESLYRDVADRVDVENRAFLLAESMGGLSSLRLAAEGDVPVAAWAGIYPVTDLGAAWQDGERRADIRSAFGIRPDGSDYALRTAGADPALIDPSAFDGLAMRFYASWQDTVVPAQEHSQAFLRRVVGHVSEGALVTHVGNHGDPSAFRPTDIVAFFDRNR